MKIKYSIRKVRNTEAYSVSVDAIKDNGSTHSKQFLVHGSKSVAKGRLAMTLRNMTQSAKVVELV